MTFFEDSHEETIYYVVSAFEQKTLEIKDYRAKRRRNFITEGRVQRIF